MKTNTEIKLLELLSNKGFSKLNNYEKEFVENNFSKTEYKYYSKLFNNNDIYIEPNISVKNNLDNAFKKMHKQKKYTLHKTILAITAVISIMIFIFILPKNEPIEKKIHTQTLLSLGRIDNIYSKNADIDKNTDNEYNNLEDACLNL